MNYLMYVNIYATSDGLCCLENGQPIYDNLKEAIQNGIGQFATAVVTWDLPMPGSLPSIWKKGYGSVSMNRDGSYSINRGVPLYTLIHEAQIHQSSNAICVAEVEFRAPDSQIDDDYDCDENYCTCTNRTFSQDYIYAPYIPIVTTWTNRTYAEVQHLYEIALKQTYIDAITSDQLIDMHLEETVSEEPYSLDTYQDQSHIGTSSILMCPACGSMSEYRDNTPLCIKCGTLISTLLEGVVLCD